MDETTDQSSNASRSPTQSAGRPSVVFCISGQLRDEHVSLPAVATQVQALGADVIISTWRRRGAKVDGIVNLDQAGRMFGEEVARALPRAMLNNAAFDAALPGFRPAAREDFTEVTAAELDCYFPGAIIDIEDEVMDLSFSEPAIADKNSLRMLYKAWRCNNIKKAAEIRNGKRYDIVVRMRPDVVPHLTADLIETMLHDMPDRSVYIPGATPTSAWLDDVLAVSSSSIADRMAGLFTRALDEAALPWDVIHGELARFIGRLELQARPLPLQRWIAEDYSIRQPANRARLRQTLESGAFNGAFFADPATWLSTALLVRAASLLIDGAGSETVMEELAAIPLANADVETIGRVAWLAASAMQADDHQASHLGFRLLFIVCQMVATENAALASNSMRGDIAATEAAAVSLGLDDPFAPDVASGIFQRLALDGVGGKLLAAAWTHITPRQVAEMLALMDVQSSVHLRDSVAAFWVHNAAGRATEMRVIAEELIRLRPQDWTGLDLLGHFYSGQGAVDLALICAQQAYAMDATHGGLAARVGTLLAQQQNWDEAAIHLERACALWASWQPCAWHSNVLRYAGRLDDAFAALNEAERRHQIETGAARNAELESLANNLAAERRASSSPIG